MAASAYRPGRLLNALQCIGQTPKTENGLTQKANRAEIDTSPSSIPMQTPTHKGTSTLNESKSTRISKAR